MFPSGASSGSSASASDETSLLPSDWGVQVHAVAGEQCSDGSTRDLDELCEVCSDSVQSSDVADQSW